VTATPADSTRSVARMGSLTTAVLVVQVADSQPLTIGCPDWAGPPTTTWGGSTKMAYRFAWRGEVPPGQEPAFVVSGADWLTLVEKFGLAPRLEDRAPQGGAVATPGGAPRARPKRKLWIYAVIIAVIMFVVVPAMMTVAFNSMADRQSKDDQLKANREGQFALPFTDLRLPHGVAVDAAGNVYVADSHTNRVLKLTAGSGTQTVLPFTDLDLFTGGVIDDFIAGVAVDTAGTVYVVDYFHGRVVKLAAGSSSQTVLPQTGRWGSPIGDVAVDSAGNVYAGFSRSHYRGPSDRYLLKLAPGSDTWTTLPSAGSGRFAAVDTAGNVYVIAGGVLKLAPGSDRWTQLPGMPPFIDPLGLAVDPRGNNVYVTDHLGSRAPGGGSLFGISHPKDDAQGFVPKLPAG
jgi:DNA-binding beta-propeller fold protein YncE